MVGDHMTRYLGPQSWPYSIARPSLRVGRWLNDRAKNRTASASARFVEVNSTKHFLLSA